GLVMPGEAQRDGSVVGDRHRNVGGQTEPGSVSAAELLYAERLAVAPHEAVVGRDAGRCHRHDIHLYVLAGNAASARIRLGTDEVPQIFFDDQLVCLNTRRFNRNSGHGGEAAIITRSRSWEAAPLATKCHRGWALILRARPSILRSMVGDLVAGRF